MKPTAFLVNVVAGVVIAVLLLTWQHWVPAFLTLGFGLSTLGAFVIGGVFVAARGREKTDPKAAVNRYRFVVEEAEQVDEQELEARAHSVMSRES